MENSMFPLKKILFVDVFIALTFALNAAETVFIPENSYLLKEDKKEKKWQIKATVQRDLQAEVIKKDRVFLAMEYPIGVCVDAYYLKIPGTDGLAYLPDITFKKGNDGKLVMHVDKIDSLMFLGTLFLLIGLAALTGYFRLELESEKKKYLLPASLVFFFWGYALWYIGFSSGSFIIPTDDVHYYNIARKILALDFTSMKYRYAIGFPVLCIPFVLLSGLRDSMDFILVYMNFQTFILIPGLFLVLFRLLSVKLGLSRIRSFSVLLLWLILMVFYLPICISTKDSALFIPDTFYSSAFFSVLDQNVYFSFVQFTWLGRNAMSDYAAVFLLVILLYAAMTKSRSLIRFFILSMGFGFLCLIRINYILFAPLLAFVFYDSFSELWKDKRYYLYAALCGMAGFMFVVGWQLVLNIIQFGSPFIGPYSLHRNGPDRGFGFDVIPYGFKFLCNTNYIYVILGISSLLFIPERKTRVLLTLWIFPTLLFFFGYPGIFNSPTRFIFALYPAFSAAIVMNPIWKSAWNVRIKAVTVVVCLCGLCKSNLFYLIDYMPWALGKYGVSSTAFVIIQCLIGLFCCVVIFSLRKELKADYDNTIRHVRFLVLFTAVFFLGSLCVYIAGILILAALVYGLRDTWAAMREIGGRNGIDAPSLTA